MFPKSDALIYILPNIKSFFHTMKILTNIDGKLLYTIFVVKVADNNILDHHDLQLSLLPSLPARFSASHY